MKLQFEYKVKIETVKKFLRDNAAFQYDENVLDSWIASFEDVNLDDLNRMMQAATKKGADLLQPSEIVYLFYKAMSIDETVAKYDTTVDEQLAKQKTFIQNRLQRGI